MNSSESWRIEKVRYLCTIFYRVDSLLIGDLIVNQKNIPISITMCHEHTSNRLFK